MLHPQGLLKGSMNTEENVTTIWLLSTLGNPRSTVGHSSVVSVGSTVVKKRDILGVSIPSTCNAIQKNETRLPLRQISNLLYGVILCYNKKTEYVLSDLTAILMQLSRQKQYRFATSRRRKNAGVFSGGVGTRLEGLMNMHVSIEELLLEDDPTFDVNYMADCSVFDLETGDTKTSHTDALVIRRQDYMNELSNSERTDNSKMMPNSTSDYRSLISTIEEIPIDIDFNLDIDELEGQHGTTASSRSPSGTTGEHSSANLDRLDDANITFTNLDLEIGDNNINDNSEEMYNADSGIQAADGPGSKSNPHRKPGEVGGLTKKARVSKDTDQQILGRIKCDERIGIQTSTLRFNNDNYGQFMQQRSSRHLPHPGRNKNWKDSFLKGEDTQIGGVSAPIPILTKAWNFLFDILSNYEEGEEEGARFLDDRSAERGRQRYRTSSGSWSHGTESIRSEEQGRRQRYLRDSIDIFGMDENNQNESLNNGNDNGNTTNMLLHLDQIDEELEGANTLGELNRYYQSESIEVPSSQDFLRVDLRLPPSSFDKSDSLPRAFSKRNNEEVEDVIDTLRSRVPQRSHSGFGNRTNISSVGNVRSESASGVSTSDILGGKVLDHQSMKFYDYIKEKALFLGVETQSNYPFQRRLLFEDLLPSGSSNNEPPPISRRVVAGAFLTVLNLASKGMLAIKGDGQAEPQSATKFSTSTGRDIVLCV